MQTRDHKALATFLIENSRYNIRRLCAKAFISGNFAPDYNPFKYIYGAIKKPRFGVHNDENTRSYIYCELRILNKKRRLTPYDFFRFGVIMHLLADSFTYPHTKAFSGTIGEHRVYEKLLHTEFRKYLTENVCCGARCVRNITGEVKKQREIYAAAPPSLSLDCRSIMRVCKTVFGSVLCGKYCSGNAFCCCKPI